MIYYPNCYIILYLMQVLLTLKFDETELDAGKKNRDDAGKKNRDGAGKKRQQGMKAT